MKTIYSTLFLILSAASTIITITFAEFVPFQEQPQNFNSIELGIASSCPEEYSGSKVNQITWTVEPVDNITLATISSQPAELVNALVDENGVLKFNYNEVSLSRQSVATGVRIAVPSSNQLQEIKSVGHTYVAQVRSGFTSLSKIVVESKNTRLAFSWQGQDVDFVGAGSNILAYLGGNVNAFNLSGTNSLIDVNGNIASGEVSGSNNLMSVGGEIQDELKVTGKNNVIALPSCDKVSRTGNSNVCSEVPVNIVEPSMEETSTKLVTCSSDSRSQLSTACLTVVAAIVSLTLFI